MRLELETRRFYLGRDYTEALEAFGAVPVHLSLIPRVPYVEAALEELDGILLPGADCDVDPNLYGEDPHPKLKKVVPEKDGVDRLVLAQAEKKDLPVLAICYGMQALNVWRGGSLYQDINAQFEGAIKHEQGIPLGRSSHEIRIAGDCRLAELSAVVGLDGNIKVNSHHHQAIKLVGNNLMATAWANDQVIEGIQDTRSDKYVIGVQWHPELSWNSDAFSEAIFRDFVVQCATRAAA